MADLFTKYTQKVVEDEQFQTKQKDLMQQKIQKLRHDFEISLVHQQITDSNDQPTSKYQGLLNQITNKNEKLQSKLIKNQEFLTSEIDSLKNETDFQDEVQIVLKRTQSLIKSTSQQSYQFYKNNNSQKQQFSLTSRQTSKKLNSNSINYFSPQKHYKGSTFNYMSQKKKGNKLELIEYIQELKDEQLQIKEKQDLELQNEAKLLQILQNNSKEKQHKSKHLYTLQDQSKLYETRSKDYSLIKFESQRHKKIVQSHLQKAQQKCQDMTQQQNNVTQHIAKKYHSQKKEIQHLEHDQAHTLILKDRLLEENQHYEQQLSQIESLEKTRLDKLTQLQNIHKYINFFDIVDTIFLSGNEDQYIKQESEQKLPERFDNDQDSDLSNTDHPQQQKSKKSTYPRFQSNYDNFNNNINNKNKSLRSSHVNSSQNIDQINHKKSHKKMFKSLDNNNNSRNTASKFKLEIQQQENNIKTTVLSPQQDSTPSNKNNSNHHFHSKDLRQPKNTSRNMTHRLSNDLQIHGLNEENAQVENFLFQDQQFLQIDEIFSKVNSFYKTQNHDLDKFVEKILQYYHTIASSQNSLQSLYQNTSRELMEKKKIVKKLNEEIKIAKKETQESSQVEQKIAQIMNNQQISTNSGIIIFNKDLPQQQQQQQRQQNQNDDDDISEPESPTEQNNTNNIVLSDILEKFNTVNMIFPKGNNVQQSQEIPICIEIQKLLQINQTYDNAFFSIYTFFREHLFKIVNGIQLIKENSEIVPPYLQKKCQKIQSQMNLRKIQMHIPNYDQNSLLFPQQQQKQQKQIISSQQQQQSQQQQDITTRSPFRRSTFQRQNSLLKLSSQQQQQSSFGNNRRSIKRASLAPQTAPINEFTTSNNNNTRQRRKSKKKFQNSQSMLSEDEENNKNFKKIDSSHSLNITSQQNLNDPQQQQLQQSPRNNNKIMQQDFKNYDDFFQNGNYAYVEHITCFFSYWESSNTQELQKEIHKFNAQISHSNYQVTNLDFIKEKKTHFQQLEKKIHSYKTEISQHLEDFLKFIQNDRVMGYFITPEICINYLNNCKSSVLSKHSSNSSSHTTSQQQKQNQIQQQQNQLPGGILIHSRSPKNYPNQNNTNNNNNPLSLQIFQNILDTILYAQKNYQLLKDEILEHFSHKMQNICSEIRDLNLLLQNELKSSKICLIPKKLKNRDLKIQNIARSNTFIRQQFEKVTDKHYKVLQGQPLYKFSSIEPKYTNQPEIQEKEDPYLEFIDKAVEIEKHRHNPLTYRSKLQEALKSVEGKDQHLSSTQLQQKKEQKEITETDFVESQRKLQKQQIQDQYQQYLEHQQILKKQQQIQEQNWLQQQENPNHEQSKHAYLEMNQDHLQKQAHLSNLNQKQHQIDTIASLDYNHEQYNPSNVNQFLNAQNLKLKYILKKPTYQYLNGNTTFLIRAQMNEEAKKQRLLIKATLPTTNTTQTKKQKKHLQNITQCYSQQPQNNKNPKRQTNSLQKKYYTDYSYDNFENNNNNSISKYKQNPLTDRSSSLTTTNYNNNNKNKTYQKNNIFIDQQEAYYPNNKNKKKYPKNDIQLSQFYSKYQENSPNYTLHQNNNNNNNNSTRYSEYLQNCEELQTTQASSNFRSSSRTALKKKKKNRPWLHNYKSTRISHMLINQYENNNNNHQNNILSNSHSDNNNNSNNLDANYYAKYGPDSIFQDLQQQ